MKWRYDVQHIATAVRLVMDGVALTVAPQLAGDVSVAPGIVALPIRNPSITRTLGLITRRGFPLSSPGEILRDIILNKFRDRQRTSDE